MANLHYFRDVEVDESDKFLTVGELMSILEDVNPETKIFIRNLDEWGGKPVIENLDSRWELSDGLITDVKKANIDQVTGEEEYIIIQGLINKEGFVTLDHEPYEETIYHHTWIEKMLRSVNPVTTMKQLRDRYLKVDKMCKYCNSYESFNQKCDKSKLKKYPDDSCELYEYGGVL